LKILNNTFKTRPTIYMEVKFRPLEKGIKKDWQQSWETIRWGQNRSIKGLTHDEGLLKECSKEENVEVTGATSTSCLKRRL
jgi:hypothetical protein